MHLLPLAERKRAGQGLAVLVFDTVSRVRSGVAVFVVGEPAVSGAGASGILSLALISLAVIAALSSVAFIVSAFRRRGEQDGASALLSDRAAQVAGAAVLGIVVLAICGIR